MLGWLVGIDKICFFSTYFAFLFCSTFSPILLFSLPILRGTQLSQPSLEIIVCRPNVELLFVTHSLSKVPILTRGFFLHFVTEVHIF